MSNINVDIISKTIAVSVSDDRELALATAAAVSAKADAEDARDDAESSAITASAAATLVTEKTFSWFPSVAAMRAEESLVPGVTVGTTGYYTPNDGGAAVYNIRAKVPGDVEDGGSIIFLVDGEGNPRNVVAELITDAYICPEQFGAYGDGTHDDTTALQKAIDTEKTLVLTKNYKITDTINVKNSLICENNALIIWGDAESTTGYGVLISLDIQRRNNKYKINFDANNLKEYGIGVGLVKNADLDLSVVNSVYVGIETGYISNGNNENRFNCSVYGNYNGGSSIGVLWNCYDSIAISINTCATTVGCKLEDGVLIARNVHHWIPANATSINAYWENSSVLEVHINGTFDIQWLFQDTCRYAITGTEAQGYVQRLSVYNEQYDGNLDPMTVNMNTTSNRANKVIIGYYMPFNWAETPTWSFMNNDYSVFGCLNIIDRNMGDPNTSLCHFNDCDYAPTIGKFYVPYSVSNLPAAITGVLECEYIGGYAFQTYYRPASTASLRTVYRRSRKRTESTWSEWAKYSPDA